MSELSQRRLLRASITSIHKESVALANNEGIEVSITRVEALLLRLEEVQTQILSANEKGLAALQEEELEEEFVRIESYAMKACEAKATLLRIQRRKSASNGASNDGDSSSASDIPQPSTATTATSQPVREHIRLPKLEIRKFHGKMAEFQTFWDQYLVAVHNNNAYTAVDKFIYLRQHLTGPAFWAISGLPVTEANYREAIHILKNRFGNKETAAQEIIVRLQNCQAAPSLQNIAQVRKTYDFVNAQVRALSSLGMVSRDYSVILHATLLHCMPAELIIDHSRIQAVESSASNTSDFRNLDSNDVSPNAEALAEKCVNMMSYFEREILIRERLVITQNVFSQSTNSQSTPKNANNRSDNRSGNLRNMQGRNNGNSNRSQATSPRPTSSGFVAVTNNRRATTGGSKDARRNENRSDNRANGTPGCIFCNASHDSKACEVKSLDERRSIMRSQGRCFRCLDTSHYSRQCSETPVCNTCEGNHLTIFHDASWQNRRRPSATQSQNPTQSSSSFSATADLANSQAGSAVALQTAGAVVYGSTKTEGMKVRVFFDSGSTRSYISAQVSKQLNLNSSHFEKMRIRTFLNSSPIVKECRVVLLNVESSSGEPITIEAIEMEDDLCEVAYSVSPDLTGTLDRLQVRLTDPMLVGNSNMSGKVDLLIGADFYSHFITGERKQVSESLVAIGTRIGWTLLGPLPATSVCATVITMNCVTELVPAVERMWELDHLGICERQSSTLSAQEKLAADKFESSVKQLEDGHYEVRLPWKADRIVISNNRDVAVNRLNSLMSKLHCQGVAATERYNEAITAYERDGYAEKVPKPDVVPSDSVVYVMPHRSVIRDDKTTTKTRIVFDCSSKAPGQCSLNDMLLQGPNLNPDLIALLINFRCHSIAFAADITKAFLQVRINEVDRNALRYLWVHPETAEVEEYRMVTLPFGTRSSPYLLAAVIRHHLDKNATRFPSTAEALSKFLYVDDYIDGGPSKEFVKKRYKEATSLMLAGGFHLTKWVTNDPELQQWFDNQNGSPTVDSEPGIFGVLGLGWNRESDTLYVNAKNVFQFAATQKVTKRSVLQISARLYDPLGLIAPYVVNARILFQRIWQFGLGWDDELPSELASIWMLWLQQVPYLLNIQVPRCSLCEGTEDVTLHVFSDASPSAYAAAVYIRCKTANDVFCNLVTAKCRVAPIKKLTLPRLELMGALIAVRLYLYVIEQAPIRYSSVYFWVDSQIALHWIQGDPARWKEFVSNRVREIQSSVNPSWFRHCPGSCNPADLATRGISSSELATASRWWHGPEYLRQPQECWPQRQPVSVEKIIDLASEETRAQYQVSAATIDDTPSVLTQLVNDIGHYERRLRVTAYVLRFTNNMLSTIRTDKAVCKEPISIAEINDAEFRLIVEVQRTHFGEDIARIKRKQPLSTQSVLRGFRPVIDRNGVLRIETRLGAAPLTEEEKCPIVLPSKGLFVESLVRREHCRLLHSGVSSVLAHLRERYWVIRGRQVAKKVLSRCIACKLVTGRSGDEITAPLPFDRVSPTKPFECVGVDFCGPLFVKSGLDVTKSYICLFTCATSRLIHLELVTGLTANHFILALRRFASRRGLCRVIWSDNAMAFRKANEDLLRLFKSLRSDHMLSYLGSNRIHWKFIAPRASWWGGFYERLIGSVKIALKKTLGRTCVVFEELQTILCEAEAAINSRPLTINSDDPNDDDTLSPAHVLIGRRLTALPDGATASEVPVHSSRVVRQLNSQRERLVQSFWNKWKKEYLLQLRSAHRDSSGRSRPIAVGDIVLVHDENRHRLLWRKARVMERHVGRDGNARSYSLRLANGNLITRPIQLLYPLEVCATDV